MSEPQNNSNPVELRPNYDVPENPVTMEFALVDEFKSRFPEYSEILAYNLGEVKRHAGFGVPNFRPLDGGMPEEGEDPILDMLNGPASPGDMNALMLVPLRKPTREEFEAMTPDEQRRFQFESSGTTALSPWSEPTFRMLEGLYELTGAVTLRDDRTEESPNESVIRGGIYQGKAVYFEEQRTAWTSDGEPAGETLRVWLHGSESVERPLTQLNQAEVDEFAERAGLKPNEVMRNIVEMNVDRNNYKEIGDVLGETKDIIDGADQHVVVQALADTVDDVFAELGVKMNGQAVKVDRDMLEDKLPKMRVDANGNLVVQRPNDRIRNLGRKMLGRKPKGSK